MKSLTFSCLTCAPNLYFAQTLLRKAKFSRGCQNRKKLLKSCRAQSSGKAQRLCCVTDYLVLQHDGDAGIFGCKRLVKSVAQAVFKMADDEGQEDELLALASIYDERIFIQSSEEKGGQLNIFLDLPKPFQLKIHSRYLPKELKKQKNRTNDRGASNDDQDVLEVQHLPPIVLNFRFPKDYPSRSPPLFTLSCKWLTVFQVR